MALRMFRRSGGLAMKLPGLDEGGSLVVIECKRVHGEIVINQALLCILWLLCPWCC
ncbi:hypothetical protein GCM10009759_17720 [Kitasatospora saccharophila]|uniref:Uncharacterized protein n=1 Tax=Kitasatospora saccharophila TaxID=407973 RepID=A0ABN2WHB5_9ACTN